MNMGTCQRRGRTPICLTDNYNDDGMFTLTGRSTLLSGFGLKVKIGIYFCKTENFIFF